MNATLNYPDCCLSRPVNSGIIPPAVTEKICMREYQRTTRECSVAELRPELAKAIREYAVKHDLGDVEAELIICCETTSERLKKGLLSRLFGDPDALHHTAMLLTPGLLIWGTTGDRRGTSIVSARLADIEVRDYDSSLIEDSGLDIFGFLNQSSERVHAFIGLGEGEAAERFRRALKERVVQSSVR